MRPPLLHGVLVLKEEWFLVVDRKSTAPHARMDEAQSGEGRSVLIRFSHIVTLSSYSQSQRGGSPTEDAVVLVEVTRSTTIAEALLSGLRLARAKYSDLIPGGLALSDGQTVIQLGGVIPYLPRASGPIVGYPSLDLTWGDFDLLIRERLLDLREVREIHACAERQLSYVGPTWSDFLQVLAHIAAVYGSYQAATAAVTAIKKIIARTANNNELNPPGWERVLLLIRSRDSWTSNELAATAGLDLESAKAFLRLCGYAYQPGRHAFIKNPDRQTD